MVDCLIKNKHMLTKCPSNEEWIEFQSLHKLFEPFHKAIAILGGDGYTTASSVLPLIAYLRQQMTIHDGDNAYIQEFKQVFVSQLNSYVLDASQNQHLQLATALDIRYKRLLSLPKERRPGVWSTLNAITKKLVESTANPVDAPTPKRPRTSLLSLASDDGEVIKVEDVAESEMYLSEFEMYKHLPQINDDEQCPLHWWSQNAATYPILSQLARQYLAIPATSIPCEQLFSNGREMLNKKRCALLPDDTSHSLCLSDWLS